jgi:tetratricopeptide (TPR) repeat protein
MLDLILAATLAAAPGTAGADSVPLYDDLGTHHYAVSTSNPRAQAYFDQGLRLYYAFNHAESIRAFEEATRQDPDCAMCHWGIAMALGPNINMPMDPSTAPMAWDAISRALVLAPTASPREEALIRATTTRYAPDADAPRPALDSAWVRAMADVVARFPDDPEASTLLAEGMMNLRPWDYWASDGSPHPGTERILELLTSVIRNNPDHPGGCHFYIHAVEAVQPELAVPCAERLADLMPGAGHLVHMPAHIYIRVGRYADAIRSNEHAIHADESYIQDQRPGANVYTMGYYPHNYDFLAFAAAMAGDRELSLQSAARVAELIPEEFLRVDGMFFLQNYLARILQMQVRFEAWDEILATPEPAADLLLTRAIWHYARGRAFVARGLESGFAHELDRLREIVVDPGLDGKSLEFNEAGALLTVAEGVLAGYVAAARGRFDEAVGYLSAAAAMEDGFVYGEPPEWSVPVRHDLGAVLLQAGRAVEAEAVFAADLKRFPENGWALRGLGDALRLQGRTAEAEAVQARLLGAWHGSRDVPGRAGAHDHH